MKGIYAFLSIGILLATQTLLGCSSGGYDDSANDTQTPNTLSFTVSLDGSQQVPQPVQTAATGTAELVLNQETGELNGSVTVINPISTITAAHIHQSVAGTNSSPFIPLERSNIDDNVWNVPAGTTLTGDEVAMLLEGGMYINIHSNNHPAGEIRGQIVGDDTEVIRVKLTGANEVPSVDTLGEAIAYITVNKNTADITAIVHINNLIATAVHLHQGFAGVNGSPVITLNENSNDSFLWEASSTLTEDQLSTLLNGSLYINVHTTANPSGEIRGQIAPAAIKIIQTTLDGNQQTPNPVSTNGTGTGFVTLDTTTGDITAKLRVENLSGAITNAHIHQAVAGTNGGVAVPLAQNDTDNSLWEADTTLTSAQQQALLHGEMYFNVHSSAFADGELRGQILIPSFRFIQNTVFNTRCISCHSASGASGGLQLDYEDTFARLVLTASNQNSAVDLVAPGDPDNSYLIHKLEGIASVGGQMPPNGGSLEPVVIDNIRLWIAQGAEHN